jgi:C4-dicarboxylate-specific signal transduction histidine kinase
MAHELNQPLVGVRGLAEHLLIALERGWPLSPDKLREKLALIVEQADRMSHIIEHVRRFARDAGKPDFRPVQINDMVRGVVNLVGTQFMRDT